MEKKKLKRTHQCAKCPWKVSTDPNEIPHGYCELKHKGLENTIADPDDPVGQLRKHAVEKELRIMACHHSTPESQEHCVGWLMNQLGPGNNIPLRIRMMNYDNVGDVVLVGKQHSCFEDTLPENKKA
jgi:hypothetical protein